MPEGNLNLKLIDAWVNPNVAASVVDPTVSGLFPGLAERKRRGTTLPQLVEEMDASGVERAVLCAGYRGENNLGWVEEAQANYPGRFTGSLVVDPRKGMSAVRALESAVRDSGVRLARVMALDTQLPYDNAAYYPLYAKCIELDIPISVNVGLPGPRVPGRHQNPISLDDVAYFFPELTIIMAHGGDPWVDICVKLMRKWENLYYMTSAYSPKRIPLQILDYINGSGQDRIMWATDYPVLDFARCRSEIERLPLKDEARIKKFVYENSLRILF
jgi:predicted TIM-barrel fold metal-dependent hydrolase